MKLLLPATALGLMAISGSALAQTDCGVTAHPSVMVGLSYVFGASGEGGDLGVTAKVLTTNAANSVIAGAGVSFYPGAKEKFGLDVGLGFNATNVAVFGAYDLLQQGPAVSAGWSPTVEPTPCDPSDARLKRDIRPVHMGSDGVRLYSFKYLWSDETYVGLMAQDVLADPSRRDAVVRMDSGFYAVNYGVLGLRMASLSDWQRRGMEAVTIH
jgi:hypothetical protein